MADPMGFGDVFLGRSKTSVVPHLLENSNILARQQTLHHGAKFGPTGLTCQSASD